MLLVPWAIGCGVARRLAWPDLLLLAALLLFFLAHHQLLSWLRRRLVAAPDPGSLGRARGLALLLAGAGGVAILPLLALDRLTALLALGAIAGALAAASLYLVWRRLDHGLAGQVLAPVGLALSAPAAHSVARGVLDRTSFAPASGVLVLATCGFLVATARVEEAENLGKFGAEYAAYMRRTRMFLPFVW